MNFVSTSLSVYSVINCSQSVIFTTNESKMASISLTFSSSGENFYGNEVRGNMTNGLTPSQIHKGCPTVVDLNRNFKNKYRDPGAYLGIVKGFCDEIKKELWSDLISLEWDKKHWDPRREEVVNKHARTNLLFVWDYEQGPDYPNKKGTVYDIKRIPSLMKLCEFVERQFSNCGFEFPKEKFIIEGNLYPESNGYISFHGDSERKLVAGIRLGSSNPLYFGWWQYDIQTKTIMNVPNSMTCLVLDDGDLYMMSEKAVGTDWEKGRNKLPHLRHAAGKLVSLLYNDAWKPYKENEDRLQRLVFPSNDPQEFDSEIHFPLGRKDEVIGYLGRLFFSDNQSDRSIIDRNWWNRYHGTYGV